MSKTEESPSKHLFSADRPISSCTEDLLGRSPFAKSLATAIKGWQEKDSLVIALYGHWGSGKTSLKNLILDSLREHGEGCPFVVEFNPWHWSGRDQLLQAFFYEIGLTLGNSDKTPKGKDRAEKWQRYGAYLNLGASISHSLKEILPNLGVPGANILFALIAKGLDKSSEVVKEGAKAVKKKAESAEPSLLEFKQEITKDLRSLKRPILIIIDDIDRLPVNEIRCLFQLVKANADFPNLIYLLLFQRDIIEKSLEQSPGVISGKDFLEKIVQVGFDIPLIERSRLEKVLFSNLDELLSLIGDNERFDQGRWGDIFIPGLRPYFQSLRDVNRFTATLSFHISLFRKADSFEVNPIDLIALEVLRVFEPGVYQRIPEAKSVLTERRDSSYNGKAQQDADKALVQSIIDQAPPENHKIVSEILKELFPRIEWILGGSSYGDSFIEGWFRDLRVCHPDVFDRYFHFAIPEGDVSQYDLDRILNSASDRGKLVSEFRALNERKLLGIALDRLDAYKEKIDIKNAIPFVTAIFDIGDELPEEPPGFFLFGPDTHANRIVFWHLMQEKDIRVRADILKKAMKRSPGLYLPIDRTQREDSKREQGKDPDNYLVGGPDIEELKAICLKKIAAAARSGLLKTHSKLLRILYCWRRWESPDVSGAWVTKLIARREGLLLFLKAVLEQSTVQEMGNSVAKIHRYIKLRTIADFVPVDLVVEKVKKIHMDKLDEEEKRAVNAFQKAIKRRHEERLMMVGSMMMKID